MFKLYFIGSLHNRTRIAILTRKLMSYPQYNRLSTSSQIMAPRQFTHSKCIQLNQQVYGRHVLIQTYTIAFELKDLFNYQLYNLLIKFMLTSEVFPLLSTETTVG